MKSRIFSGPESGGHGETVGVFCLGPASFHRFVVDLAAMSDSGIGRILRDGDDRGRRFCRSLRIFVCFQEHGGEGGFGGDARSSSRGLAACGHVISVADECWI